ncbi:MAG: AMP-binding protein [Rhodospirillales bacterium]|nr:AMP-binding protein [Rhodospirillales bacterium]
MKQGEPFNADASQAEIVRLRHSTIPGLLAARAKAEPDRIAYRAKIRGIYQERSWADFADRVARCAFGFMALGLRKGDRVAIMGDCCEGWTLADLGAQAAGGISYGIYPTASVAEVKYHLEHGGAELFVAEDQEHVDKILPLLDQLPHLRHVIVIDTTALFAYDHPKIIAFDKVMALGAEEADQPGAFEALVAQIRPEQMAFIIYTSGTTGNPKGAAISHGRHLAAVYSTFLVHYPTLETDPHRVVAFLPLGHIIGRNSTITIPLMGSMIPHYGENVDDIATTLFEVAPTFIFTVPRYLQKFASNVLIQLENSSPLKRRLYERAFAWGRRNLRRRWDGRQGPLDPALGWFWRQLAFRPILNKLGFDRVELAITGGAATGRELMALWQIWGMNLVEVYGQTETAGSFIAGQKGPFPRPGPVGVPTPGWEVSLGVENEILVRSPDNFNGYWHDDKATREAVDSDGWLHTGDIGLWEDGQLKIIDRAKDIIITSGGKNISPTAIETEMRASPYISEAIVFGDNEKYLTALIEIDYDAVANWANRKGLVFTGFASLAGHPEVVALIDQEIAAANTNLARVEQIKAFRILPKTLDPEEEGEPVTPTRKVKRKQMHARYRELVQSMYSHDEENRLHDALADVFQPQPGAA